MYIFDRGPRVRASPASLLCGPWARHIYPSLVLVQPRKTRPWLSERLLMGRKESNQTNKPTCIFINKTRLHLCFSVLFCYAFMYVCLLMPCGHLLGKGWPLGTRLWCLLWFCYFAIWYPGTGVALHCIDSWPLLSSNFQFYFCIF